MLGAKKWISYACLERIKIGREAAILLQVLVEVLAREKGRAASVVA